LLQLSFVCLDTETTGLESTAEIIEIGMVKVENGVVTDRYSRLIHPRIPISKTIEQLTGISNEMVAEAPYWKDVEAEILGFIDGFTLVAHNVDFDRGRLEYEFDRKLSNPWLDTHDVAKIFLPTLTSYKLISLATALDIPASGFHRALADADVTTQVLLRMTEIATGLDPFVMQKICDVMDGVENGTTAYLQAVQRHIVSSAYVGKSYVEPETTVEYGKTPAITFAEAGSFFDKGGLMDQCADYFQYREPQKKMEKMIAECFENENHGIIEAGTGTGKSFAYLLPSLLWAYENQCRVLISTNTIALQEQLYFKDVPFLKQALNFDFPVALVKGRSNYICLRRYEQYIRQASSLQWTERIFLAGLIYWMNSTPDGDKEHLYLNSMEHQWWSAVASQSETCLGNQCSMYRKCFYVKNRRACENSMVMITNHALLLQNVKLDHQLLPAYDHVIIDEAHNLEEEAIRQFTDTVDLDFLRKSGQRLLRPGSIVHRIVNKVKNQHEEAQQYGELLLAQRELKDDMAGLEEACKSAIDFVHTVPQLAHSNEWRITEKERNTDWWNHLAGELERVNGMVMAIRNRLSFMRTRIDLFEDLDLLAKELVFQQSWYEEQHVYLENFLKNKRKADIHWIDYPKSSWGSNLALSVAPIDVMPLLKEKLFAENKSVILTSATLAISGNLKYTAQLYLLEEGEYVDYITPAPFNYASQSCIAIPTDMVDYSQVGEHVYTEKLIAGLKQIMQSVSGGVLVLFTSYAMLNKVYFELKRDSALADYQILAHGQDGNRSSILQAMNRNANTVVLGASSFWEGVDVRGSGLTTLIITKLPFQPPTRPVTSARMEYLSTQGKNSFSDFSLPQAVLKFRQGCGRLIRSSEDWGSIIILDKRVLTKGYGKDFIKSLPKQPVLQKPMEEICTTLERWMAEKQKENET